MANQLPPAVYLGTSSWNFSGWEGLVWDRAYPEKRLSREGLAAYAAHPLFDAVSLDRAFYRPLSTAQYAGYAADVPETFRFVVKAPALVTDARIRGPGGRAQHDNPSFLDPEQAWTQFVAPAAEGLAIKTGALVFQISPLSPRWRDDIETAIERLHGMLQAASAVRRHYPKVVIAVEVRDPQWLTPSFVAALRDSGTTYCLGLHPRMPPIDKQLPILRALWPGPFVCRWNLNPRHGAYGYERARAHYAPFNALVDPDLQTRQALARVVAGTAGAGQPVFVTINNKAEGSAPLSVRALADAVRALSGRTNG